MTQFVPKWLNRAGMSPSKELTKPTEVDLSVLSVPQEGVLGGSGQDEIDGQTVRLVLWETSKMVIFEDQDGNVWRYLPAFGKSWPVTILRGSGRIV